MTSQLEFCVSLTQLPDEGHKFLVLAQRQDGALVWRDGCWEAEELQEGENWHSEDLTSRISTLLLWQILLTVRCSSPSRTWKVCSKMVYMILPMPKEGSMTLGMISSTAGDK